ncbi:hypothetical protein EOS_09620 [Caballeronia mineralivorans PML1(12)]|uniref:Lipoprotein n=1 Tax=Caballeronia mineralivorans PML1(12) TaxID=908627 RepID=A0A0J1D0Z8_9BURK|nr:hypothetical protein EOS_09620 [Caballeronia mineralivorans PML1(12)]
MTMLQRSWFLTGLISLGCAALSAYVNFFHAGAQPGWLAQAHVGAAFIGSGLLARFVQGSRKALAGPTSSSMIGTGVVARVGVVTMFVPGKSAFCSPRRSFQLLGFIVCLMVQFVVVAQPAQDQGYTPVKSKPVSHQLAT